MTGDYAHIIASMTVGDFGRFKRAYSVLLQSGLSPDDAIQILAVAYDKMRGERASERMNRAAERHFR